MSRVLKFLLFVTISLIKFFKNFLELMLALRSSLYLTRSHNHVLPPAPSAVDIHRKLTRIGPRPIHSVYIAYEYSRYSLHAPRC